MLPPESSPIHQLVAPWWRAREWPRLSSVPTFRLMLMEAAIREMTLRAALGEQYDPFSDARLLWASQHLNRASNRSLRIHPDVTARAAIFFDSPLLPCGKDRAVGST